MNNSTKSTTSCDVTIREKVQVLTKAAIRASVKLGITDDQLAQILDIGADTVAKFISMEKTLEYDTKPFQNAVLLVRLFRSLSIITGGDQKARQSWIYSHNTALNDSPIKLLTNRTGLEDVVKYLDSRLAPV